MRFALQAIAQSAAGAGLTRPRDRLHLIASIDYDGFFKMPIGDARMTARGILATLAGVLAGFVFIAGICSIAAFRSDLCDQCLPLYAERILKRLPIDLLWLSLIPIGATCAFFTAKGLTLGRAFLSIAMPLAIFAITYSFAYEGHFANIYPDSSAYLQPAVYGTFSEFRNYGYASFVWVVASLNGLIWIAYIQLIIVVSCYMLASWLLATRAQTPETRWLLAIFLPIGFILQGGTTYLSSQILTEALFTAGLTLLAGALGAAALRPDSTSFICAACGLALAVLSKTLGVVFIFPALLLISFMPRGKRWMPMAIAAIGVVLWTGMSSLRLYQSGNFSPESASGFALMGHVGWMLDDSRMQQSDLSREMIESVKPVIEARPAGLTEINSLATLDKYVDYTTLEYNVLLWQHLFEVGRPHFVDEQKLVNLKAENAYYKELALSSIRSHPGLYIKHVLAHFYGLWRDLSGVLPIKWASIAMRLDSSALFEETKARVKAIPFVSLPDEDALRSYPVKQTALPLRFAGLWERAPLNRHAAIVLAAISILLSALALIPSRAFSYLRAEIMIALSINAYFGAHALFQVTLSRYSMVAVPIVLILMISLVVKVVMSASHLVEFHRVDRRV